MFRISNDVQRAKTAASVEELKRKKETIENTRGEKAAKLFWKGYQSLVEQFEAQIEQYDKLRREGLPPFKGTGLSALGAYLVDARIAAGFTQEELAKQLGVSQPMVFKYELSRYQGHSLEVVQKAANALGVKIDLGVWRRVSKPVYDGRKQENVILYFLNTINNAYLGLTKLMKLLYYVDFEFYEKEGRSVTGDQYVAQYYGPVPQHAMDLLRKLEKSGKIHSEKGILGKYDQIKYYPKGEYHPSVFDSKELAHIEHVAKRFEHWTASQMTNQTHEEYPWQVTHLGDVIDYRLALSLRAKNT